MTIKNPEAPATPAQLSAIASMAAKAGVPTPDTDGLTKGAASQTISELAAILDGSAATPKPKQTLAELAAQLQGKPAPVTTPENDPTLPGLPLTVADAKVALSWCGVVDAEVGLDDADESLRAALQAYVDAFEQAKAAQPPVPTITPKPSPAVPAGHYAIGEPGQTKFYRVQHGKAGTKWDGYVFVDVQASDDYFPVKGAGKFEVLDAIKAQGVLESASRYGHELGKCFKCLKTLTDPQSIADGMGPDCKKSLGL